MTNHRQPEPITAPWVLIDELTADLLERLVVWLEGAEEQATGDCARALSLQETDDPITISSWAEALAAHLRRRAEESQLKPAQLTD